MKFAGFILFLAGVTLFFSGCKKKTDDKPTVAPPVKVTVTVLGEGGAAETGNTYSGTVASSATTMLSFSVAGTIRSLTVEEGQKVEKGQILGKVSADDYENANNITRAELAEARDAYERMKKLHDADALPEIKWVEIQQKLKQAENAAELSARTLSDATLRSPVTGSVSRKFANVGQNVVPGEPIYEIVSSGDLTIDITVPENEIGSFIAGQKAEIEFDTPGSGVLEGKVTSKSVVADPLTRGFTVKVSLPYSEKILPGMVGKVSFPFSPQPSPPNLQPTTDNSFLLPSQAVQLAEDNRNFVWIVKNGKSERRFVTADELVADGVLIKEGLQRGDTVITEGMRKVSTGSTVEIR